MNPSRTAVPVGYSDTGYRTRENDKVKRGNNYGRKTDDG